MQFQKWPFATLQCFFSLFWKDWLFHCFNDPGLFDLSWLMNLRWGQIWGQTNGRQSGNSNHQSLQSCQKNSAIFFSFLNFRSSFEALFPRSNMFGLCFVKSVNPKSPEPPNIRLINPMLKLTSHHIVKFKVDYIMWCHIWSSLM